MGRVYCSLSCFPLHIALMDFELKPNNLNAKDDDLLEDLRSVASRVQSERLTQRVYREQGRFSSGTIERRFGSWNKALELADLGISKRHNIDDEVLFLNLEAIWRSLGRQPSRADLDRVESEVSKSVYEYRFGGWRKALEAFVVWINNEGQLAEVGDTVPLAGRKTPRQPNLRLRFHVMRRDKFRCCQCGKTPATTLGCELNVDHIVSWDTGGETVLENLQTLCRDCNSGKSNLPANL